MHECRMQYPPGQAILAVSSISDTKCRVASKLHETGNEMVSLMPVDRAWWEKVMEDIFFNAFANDLLQRLINTAFEHEEWADSYGRPCNRHLL
jgi:hypothetical protein